MYVVIRLTVFASGNSAPESVIGPFDDRPAADLWAKKMVGEDYYETGKARVVQLTWILGHSVTQTVLIDGPGPNLLRVLSKQ